MRHTSGQHYNGSDYADWRIMDYDLIIIGSGPAGLTAAIYAARAELKFAVLERSPISGGQVLLTYEVDNYPGMPGMSGSALSDAFRAHCDKLGCKFITDEVEQITREADGSFLIKCSETGNITSKSIIACTGASHKTLGVPGEEELTGMGVSYCATCDGSFFKGKDVVVVGGGDVAVEDAIYLSRICHKVYLVHRRDEFRAARTLVTQARHIINIDFITSATIESINGEDEVNSVAIKNLKTGDVTSLEVNGVFIAVGIAPNSELFGGLTELNKSGYIITDESCCTAVPGLYAAGDVRTKSLRQIITAAADGAVAVSEALKFINQV